MEQIDETSLMKQGGSHYIRVPASFCNLLGWQKGTVLDVYREGDKLVYRAKEKRETGIIVQGAYIP